MKVPLEGGGFQPIIFGKFLNLCNTLAVVEAALVSPALASCRHRILTLSLINFCLSLRGCYGTSRKLKGVPEILSGFDLLVFLPQFRQHSLLKEMRSHL